MKNRWERCYGLIVLIGVAVTALALSGCQDFMFRELMEGENGAAWAGPLTIVPSIVTLTTGDDLVFAAKGGSGEYTLSIIPPGLGNTLNSNTGHYIAAFDGSDTVRVTDSKGSTSDAQLTILVGGGATPDYTVAAVPAPTFPGVGTPGGTIAGDFVIENLLNDGADTINWRVFLSNGNDTIGLGDSLVQSGTLGALLSGTQSAVIPFSGPWPTAGGTYYLIIELDANDDQVDGNDTLASGGVTYTGAAPPDYTVVVTDPAGATAVAGSTTLESITVTNTGLGTGSVGVDWEVYLSFIDSNIDGGDTLVNSGTTAVLTNPSDNESPTFNVTWPSLASNYYLVALVSASDDATDSTGASSQLAITAPTVDYYPDPAILGGLTVYQADDVIDGTFILNNEGADAGTDSVFWSVYASPNPTLDIPGDTLVDSGTASPLDAGDFIGITFNGVWPSAGGSYTVFVTVTAPGEADPSDDDSADGPHAIAPAAAPDYVVQSVTNTGTSVANGGISGEFLYRNQAGVPGAATVYWTAYYSTNNLLDGSTETVIDGGTAASLAQNTTSAVAIPFSGTWPNDPTQTYYLIVSVWSSDDPAGGAMDDGGSSLTQVAYGVQSVSNLGGRDAGGPISGQFIYENQGDADGISDINWAAYYSTNATLDGSTETVIDSGTESALAGGDSSSPIPFTGIWPDGQTVNHFLIVDVWSSDDLAGDEDNDGGQILEFVDYTVQTVQHLIGTATDGTFTANFTYRNAGNRAGLTSVSWTAYYSTAAALDGATEVPVDSGVVALLGAGASSAPIPFSGTWPSVADNYYLFVEVSNAEDSNAANDQGSVGMVSVTEQNPDYAITFEDATLEVAQLLTSQIGATLGSRVRIENGGTGNGAQDVSYQVYLSTDTVLDASDLPPIGSGTITGGMAVGVPQMHPINTTSAAWPGAGIYYLIATVNATDDGQSLNNIVVSLPIAAADQVYTEGSTVNDTIAQADSTGFTIAAGTSYAIEGQMEDPSGAFDVFRIDQGAPARDFSTIARWRSGYDDLDLAIYNSASAVLWSSIDTFPDQENGPGVLLTGFLNNTDYYVGLSLWLAGGASPSGAAGARYVVLIEGEP